MTLWGSRFSNKMDDSAWALNRSLDVDARLAMQDVDGSLAWADALQRAGVLPGEDHAQITRGLVAVKEEFSTGQFVFAPADEDIHTAVERRLTELIGPAAGRLHTGRSRNDQVATDFRLWMLQTIPALDAALRDLQSVLVERAEAAGETVMPGYTHLQRAQPILLSHWWLSHFWPLRRDRERLRDLTPRVSSLPLGSGALAGTPVAVDRAALAKALGFAGASPNSLDAVSDRDFAAEFLFVAALTGVHLSKLAEQIILFTTAEFGFFELPDTHATGSSLMPQKKNPDIFELARGKAGTLIGRLTGLLVTLKGLPSAYDKDLQEDKAAVFESADTLIAVLPVLAGALQTITVRSEHMRAAVSSFMLATDLADYLVGKGIPFREAHGISAQAVRAALEKNLELEKLPLDAYQVLSPAFEADVFQVFDPLQSIKSRKALGGTAPEALKLQLQNAKKIMQKSEL